MNNEKLISIHLNSNKPDYFERFIRSLVKNTNNLDLVEVIVSIDKDDFKMLSLINSINTKHPGFIKKIETNLIKSFSDAWKPLNILLNMTSPSVKYISCMSDDIRFRTNNWDTYILGYENYFTDNIFRIRCSKYKKETYEDIWQCGYKPDSYAFYTKKWLEIAEIWNPCIGPDTFQECIAYYMRKQYGKRYNRDLVDENIAFDGQEVSTGMKFKNRIQRTRIYYKAFFILMSYKVQSLANKKAYKISCAIDPKNISYKKLNFFKITYTNFVRRFNFFYHRGSPNHFINSKLKNIIFFIWCYTEFLDNILIKIIIFLNNKGIIEKIIKDKKKLDQIKSIINHES